MRYRKRQVPIEPIEVEACQVEDYDLDYARKHYPDWLVKRTYFIVGDDSRIVGINIPTPTPKTPMRSKPEDAYRGDYVMKGPNNEIHAVTGYNFREDFEEINDDV